MNPQERRILFFTSSTHFLTHFYMLVFPALVMPMSRDLGLPIAAVLNISFWMYLLYGLLALGWGWISDHLGHKWALNTGVILASAGFVLAGLVRSLPLLSASFALVGIGCSAYHPSGLALVSQGVRQRGRAMGINGVWGNVGMASAPLVSGLLSYLIGWRRGVVILGAAGLLLGIAAVLTPFSVAKGTEVKKVDKLASGTAVRLFAIFCVVVLFSGLMYRSFTVILPTFLESRLGDVSQSVRTLFSRRLAAVEDLPAFQTLVATLIATGVYVLGIFGQALGGRVADRHSLKWAYFIFFCAALPFIVAAAYLENVLLIPAAGMFVLFAVGMQPIENSLLAYLTPARWRSMSYGIKFTITFGAGAFAVKIVGAVQERYGVGSVIFLVAGFLALVILSAGLVLILSRGQRIRH
jgi:FSR family fosmidomycin resistance protein-like MFS transporter